MKIIILGAGIAGLTLAGACNRANMKVTVYEKASQLHNIGGGMILWPNSIRYLEWLKLAEPVKQYLIPITRCSMIGTEGNIIFQEDYAAFNELIGGPFLPIERNLLQQALQSQLPDNIIKLNKNCIRIENFADKVRVYFADGTHDEGDVLIGGDGIHSIVRKTINHDHIPEYSNNCWWGGIIEQSAVPELTSDEVFIALGCGKTCIVWPTYNNRFMWYLPVKMPGENLTTEKNGLPQLQDICRDWDLRVTKIISAQTPNVNTFHLPIYALPPRENWSTDRITVMGDAAHALGPLLGQGANQAIEDAFILFNALQNHSDNIPHALQMYENMRHYKVKRLSELENESAQLLVNDNLEEVKAAEAQIAKVDLATIYHELIPWVNKPFSFAITQAFSVQDAVVE